MNNLTVAQARQKLDSKEISSVELTKSYLDKIKQHNDSLNAF